VKTDDAIPGGGEPVPPHPVRRRHKLAKNTGDAYAKSTRPRILNRQILALLAFKARIDVLKPMLTKLREYIASY
jgi:hypothetical protein